MHSGLRYFVIFFLLAVLVGCKKPLPDPENLDPIFRDLKAMADGKKKELEEARKSRETAYINYDKEKPNTLDKKLARREYEKWEARISTLEQQARYFEIRANRRRVEDKVNYLEAFKQDKPWPSPDEYSNWIVNRKLAEAPANWGKDIPKLYDPPKKAEKKPEAKAE